MVKVLVTGANGQLGYEISQLAKSSPFGFDFTDVLKLDLIDAKAVGDYFKNGDYAFCINCAAYTAVDKAEEDKENAFLINEKAVENLAQACNAFKVVLIHVSTDFVFDGTIPKMLKEDDPTNPLSVYGISKLAGEKRALDNTKTYVLRTSWLYSSHGNNFVKTMIKLSQTRNELGIIVDQVGTPTYASDLASTILKIIKANQNGDESYGIFHYSNEGVASWYDFAIEIFSQSDIEMKVNPIPTEAYPTPAKRPHFSVMDKTKIKNTFNIEIPHWKMSLSSMLKALER